MSDKEKLTFSYYGSSDIGMIRVENQDSLGKFPPNDFNLYTERGQLFIVADGMGGHVGGKEASNMAVDTISDVYFSGSSDLLTSLKEAIEKANYKIFKKSEDSKELRGMGTTCTVLVLKNDKGVIAHVGDSRIYLIENNSSKKIVQLTEDHTKVHEMVKEGILTEKEAESYPSKSVLSRALGVEQKVNVDFKNIAIKKGQSYVMCSDGLSGVSKEEILQIVTTNSAEESCSKLINLANDRGGKDNVTVIVINIGTNKFSNQISPVSVPRNKKKYLLPIFLIIFFSLIIAAGIKYQNYILDLFNSSKVEKITKDEPVTRQDNIKKKTDSFNSLLEQADKLYADEKFDDALVIYKRILSSEPMHLGALQGINNIAASYISKAEKYKNENKLAEALKFYRKALNIQPGNKRVEKLINDCEAKLHN